MQNIFVNSMLYSPFSFGIASIRMNLLFTQIENFHHNQLFSFRELNQLHEQFSYLNQKVLKKAQMVRQGKQCSDLRLTEGKKLLLLDLDRTIIYYDDEEIVHVRPGLQDFLTKFSTHFDIYVFTAATDQYAQMILSNLKEEEINNIRGLLTRKNCTLVVDKKRIAHVIKDLKILSSCSLKDIILVDDNPLSFIKNVENAIPIKPFEGDKNDDQLMKLEKILDQVKELDDVREYLNGKFFPKTNN